MKKRQAQVTGMLLDGNNLEEVNEASPREFMRSWMEENSEVLNVTGYLPK